MSQVNDEGGTVREDPHLLMQNVARRQKACSVCQYVPVLWSSCNNVNSTAKKNAAVDEFVGNNAMVVRDFIIFYCLIGLMEVINEKKIIVVTGVKSKEIVFIWGILPNAILHAKHKECCRRNLMDPIQQFAKLHWSTGY